MHDCQIGSFGLAIERVLERARTHEWLDDCPRASIPLPMSRVKRSHQGYRDGPERSRIDAALTNTRQAVRKFLCKRQEISSTRNTLVQTVPGDVGVLTCLKIWHKRATGVAWKMHGSGRILLNSFYKCCKNCEAGVCTLGIAFRTPARRNEDEIPCSDVVGVVIHAFVVKKQLGTVAIYAVFRR